MLYETEKIEPVLSRYYSGTFLENLEEAYAVYSAVPITESFPSVYYNKNSVFKIESKNRKMLVKTWREKGLSVKKISQKLKISERTIYRILGGSSAGNTQ